MSPLHAADSETDGLTRPCEQRRGAAQHAFKTLVVVEKFAAQNELHVRNA